MLRVDPQLEKPVKVSGAQPEIAVICEEANALRNGLYATIISGTVAEERQKLNVQDLTRVIEKVSQLADPKLIPADKKLLQNLSSALHGSSTLNRLQTAREQLQETVNLLNAAKAPPPNAWAEWIWYGDLKKRLETLQAANELARAAETALQGNGVALKHAAGLMAAKVTSDMSSNASGLAPRFATRLHDFQQAADLFEAASISVMNRDEIRLLDKLRFGCCEVSNGRCGLTTLRQTRQELEHAVSKSVQLGAPAKIAAAAHDLLRELRLAEISCRGPDVLLRAADALLAPLQQRLTEDRAALDSIETEVNGLRVPGLRAIENMQKLANLGLTYEENQKGIGPALLFPSGMLKNNQVEVGTNLRFRIDDKICCVTATLQTVLVPQLDKLTNRFGPEVMAEAFHQWLFTLPNLGVDEKGPIAVVSKLGLGREIELQDLQKGDLIQWWKNPDGHSAIVTDPHVDPKTGRVKATIISASRQKNPTIPAIRSETVDLTDLQKRGFHVYAARLLVDSSDTTFKKDKLLQAQADGLKRSIGSMQRTVDELDKLKDELGKGLSPREAVKRLVELLELCQFDPSGLEAAIERIWIEAGGQGEPPKAK